MGRKAVLSDVKAAFRFSPALNRWLLENSSCKQFQVQKDQDELDTLATLNTKNGNLQQQRTKQTWHQNEATPRESKRNAPTREQMRLLDSAPRSP